MKKLLATAAFAALASFTTSAEAALQLFLEASPGPVLPGEPIVQMVTVRNDGASAVADVVVTVQQPASTDSYPQLAPGASCPGVTCDASEFATWTFDTLPAGASRTVYLSANVKQGASAPAPGTLLALDAGASASGATAVSANDAIEVGGDVRPLRLIETVDRATATAGQQVTYTLQYANASLDAGDPQVGALTLEADIPPGTTLVSADGAFVDGNTLRWDIGAVALRSSGIARYTVEIGTSPGTDRLVADARLFDDTGRHAAARRLTPLVSASPLHVFLTPSAGPALPGEPLTQTVVVRNSGTSTLSGVSLQLLMPFGTASYPVVDPAASCPGVTCDQNEFATWSLGALTPGQSRRVQMTTSVRSGTSAPAEGNRLELHAIASADGVADTRADDGLLIGFEDKPLRLALTADRTTAQPGDEITYSLHYANASVTAADPAVNDLALEIALPRGTTPVSAPGAVATSFGTLRWAAGAIPARAALLDHVTVRVDTATTEDRIAAEAWLVDDNRRLAFAENVLPLAAPSPLQLSLEPSSGPALPGEPFTERLTLRNTGSSALQSVSLRLQQPAWTQSYPLTAPAATCPGVTCDANEFASWSIDTLPAGQSRSFELTTKIGTGGTLLPPQGIPIELRAVAGAIAISDVASHAIVDASFEDAPLRLAVTADRERVAAGDLLTYTLHAANGSQNAADPHVGALALEASIPRGTTPLAVAGGSLTDAGTVRWDLGAQPSRADLVRRFSVRVDTPASVDALATQAWLADDNHRVATAALDTSVGAPTPLRLFVDATPAPALAGMPLNRALTVLNAGSSTLESVAVLVQHPAYNASYPQYAPAIACPGVTCDANEFATWSVGTLAAGQSRTLDLTSLNATGSGAAPNGIAIDLDAIATAIAADSATAHDIVRAMSAEDPLRLAVDTDRQSAVAGDVVAYAFDYANVASAASDAATLEVTIPEGTTVESADGAPDVGDGTLRWSLGSLAPLGESRVHLALRVDATAPPAVTVDAHLADDAGHLASARRTTPIAAPSPLALTMTATPGPLAPGDPIALSVTVRNSSTTTLEDVRIDLQQPAWTASYPTLTPGADCPGVTCDANEFAEWTLGDLAAGESRTVELDTTLLTGNSAAPAGTVIELDALARALVTTSAHVAQHRYVGTAIVPGPGDDRIFADGFDD